MGGYSRLKADTTGRTPNMIEESGSHRTPRWREMDSISRFAYFFEQSSNHADLS